MGSAVRRWWPLAGVAVLLAVASMAAAHSSLGISRIEQPVDDLPEPALPGAPPSFSPRPDPVAAEPADVPEWIFTVAVVFCVVAATVVVGLLLWALIRAGVGRRGTGRMPAAGPGSAPSPRTADSVVAVLDAGLVDLSDSDTDPRRAVIACWVRLEQAAAAAGTPRQIGDTPTDLVTRLLRSHDVSADVLADLAEVYREARYATRTVDERMRVRARSALRRLRAELTATADVVGVMA